MRRLAAYDKALVLLLVPLWAACFALAVRSLARGDGRPVVGVASPVDAASHPTATGRVYPPARAIFEASGIRRGDRLVRLGDVDLRGVGPVRLAGLASELGAGGRRVPLTLEREGARLETFFPMAPLSAYRAALPVSFATLALALLLVLRARPTPMIRAWLYASIALAFAVPYYGGSQPAFYAWVTTNALGTVFTLPLLVRFFQSFPSGAPPRTRLARAWPWLFAVHGPFNLLMTLGAVEIGARGTWTAIALGAIAVVALLTRSYRRGSALDRRQIKWVLFGAYCAAAPMVAAGVLSALDPRFAWLGATSWAAFPILLAALLVSVARFNVFDIDRLLSATASYNLLLVPLVGAGLALVPRVADALSLRLGIDSDAGRVGLSLLLAGVIVPANRRLRPEIDRLLFHERHDADRAVAELLPALSGCANAQELVERTGAGIERAFRPDACVVYARSEGRYAPVFVTGRAVPPAFGEASSLVAALEARRAPLALAGAGRPADRPALGAFERAALETLEAEVVLPVRREGLVAFLCLGPKRSGDVYTPTDFSLLTAVAETVSRELQHFDQEEVIRQGREMQESLRRYVPGAVAEQLSAGAEPASGEREVSVLFVDIRGYTGFSEPRRAADVFSTVNAYTRLVSRIVRGHGGHVIEFNGDGMMAVFGAPAALDGRERAAVAAGEEIVREVASMRLEDDATRLSVGVGIASGEAFVGSIQAVDRMIWTAIGNTVNLAARLQALTRDLDAAIVIDAATRHALGAAGTRFARRERTPIRGRSGTRDVFALPLTAPGAA